MGSIAKAKYEGYLWWSDSREPEVLDGSKDYECSFDASQNPFVIEGNLWDATTNESVYIRYVDGQYIVRRIVVSAEELQGISDKSLTCDDINKILVATTKKTYVARRMQGVKGLKFLQYWTSEPDVLCEGMPVLQPSKLVFVGFEK